MNLVPAIVGGTLIGLAAVLLYLTLGRIAGISGVAAQALTRLRARGTEQTWPLFFIAGLGAGGWLAYLATGGLPQVSLDARSAVFFAVGGVLVGVGTRLGSGCTSGHGVCGISRLSKRSFTATVVFLLVGMITATSLAALGAGL